MTDTSEDAAVTRLLNDDAEAGVLDLGIGEPDQLLPEQLRTCAVDSLTRGVGYTPKLGLLSLREAIATETHAVGDDVVITVGGTEAVAVAIETVCGPGRGIVVPDPAWPNYRVLAEHLGIPVHTYLQGTVEGGFFDWEGIDRGLAAGASLIVVNSPSNPMASVASAAELQQLVDRAAAYGAYVLSDEAYEGIVFSGASAPSPRAATGGAERVFAARTFSKTYSMTGLRVGALISPAAFRLRVAALHGTTVGCAPRVAQEVAEHALHTLADRGRWLSGVYRERFELALQHVGEWMPQADSRSSGGFYVWLVDGDRARSAASLADEIERRGFRVSSGNAYSVRESHAVRLALTAPTERLEDAFAAVREVFSAS